MPNVKITTHDDTSTLRDQWLRQIDELADQYQPAERSVYSAKYAEACAGSGPHVESEAAARGVGVDEMCRLIIDARAASDELSAFVEARRIRARLKCLSASDPPEMLAAYRELKSQLTARD